VIGPTGDEDSRAELRIHFPEQRRIDSIAQSWAVLSGAADPVHADRAMAAVEEFLIRRGAAIPLVDDGATHRVRVVLG
jgi:cyclic beta-1,2-glucan synthetase